MTLNKCVLHFCPFAKYATAFPPHATLGSIYLQLGKSQQAVGQLEQARRIDPKDKSAYSHLAVAYRRLGQLEKAREVLSTLQEINTQEREDPRQRMKTPDPGSTPSAP